MATDPSDSAQVSELPSYEAIREAQQPVGQSDDAWRLQWTLLDPLTSAIPIMEDKIYDPNKPMVPYCVETTPSPKWSPISQSPLTEPKISSITVHVRQLDDWEENWLDIHQGHASPGPHFEGSGAFRFGELSDYNSDSDEEGPDNLLRCCGIDRLRKKKQSLLVKATGEFLTIHDFVSAVHP
ncbi:hypothetical protein BCR34DRAFT_602198 [Clohesyomyces aquaticus]|uniref:Uncharacterized protein n=1 Tax=Clohesyomyces aquaticus TaxID=1231657 RepID=A0A1Y1ZJB9_9PLEO|nr:hypothetical protein BCR34DRAFT_602198 [Clohesyomyces aquaticus]